MRIVRTNGVNRYRMMNMMCCKMQNDIQLGMIVLPKTANPDHMKANADVDFTISDEDMEILKHVEKIKDYGKHSIFPVFGGKM